MASTRPSKSSGRDLPCDLGKARERSLNALNPEDPDDKAFRLVRCTGLFLFIFVYSQLSAASPVCTSASSRAGGRRPQQRRVAAPQRRRQRDSIIAAYQRPRQRRILTQQEMAATAASPHTGGNDGSCLGACLRCSTISYICWPSLTSQREMTSSCDEEVKEAVD